MLAETKVASLEYLWVGKRVEKRVVRKVELRAGMLVGMKVEY